jgi:hypothetical protein
MGLFVCGVRWWDGSDVVAGLGFLVFVQCGCVVRFLSARCAHTVTAAGRTKALGGRNEAEADGGAEAEAGQRRRQGEAETRRGQTVAATDSVILDR